MESHLIEFVYGPLDGLEVIHTSRKTTILTECGEYYYSADFMYRPNKHKVFYIFRGPTPDAVKLHMAGY